MKYYIDLGKKLFPLNRSITGKGTFKTLKILNKENKLIKLLKSWLNKAKSFLFRKKVEEAEEVE